MLLSAGCATVAWSPHGDLTNGSGNVTQSRIAVSGASELELENIMHLNVLLDVTVGSTPQLVIEADDNLLPFIHHVESGGQIKIWTTGNLVSAHAVRIRYATPQLARLKVKGSVQVAVSGLRGAALALDNQGASKIVLDGVVHTLALTSSGAGDVHAEKLICNSADIKLYGSGDLFLGTVQGEQVKIDTSGSSDITIGGTVNSLLADSAGSGQLLLAKLATRDARVAVNGSARAEINVSGNVEVSSGGASKVIVHGQPQHRSLKGPAIEIL